MKYTNQEGEPLVGKIVGHVVGALVLLVVVFTSFGTVAAGQRGVKTQFGRVVGVIDPGIYFKLSILEKVYKMEVKLSRTFYSVKRKF